VEGAVNLPVFMIIAGAFSLLMGLIEIRDARSGRGDFSKRHLVSFGDWKPARIFVGISSWLNLIFFIGLGPMLIGIGIWSMLK